MPGAISGDSPIRWSPDGHSLYVLRLAKLPAKVYRLDALTGRREAWKEIMPADPVGVHDLDLVALTPDGKSYAYSYQRSLADLWQRLTTPLLPSFASQVKSVALRKQSWGAGVYLNLHCLKRWEKSRIVA